MRRMLSRLAIAAALVTIGWAAGRAQTTEPTFEIVVTAPGGNTTVECRRGCELSWVERGLNSNARAMQTFTYGCGASTCSSGRIGGWIK
jgi:hypothetical protein